MKTIDSEVLQLLSGCIYKYGPLENVKRTLENFTLGFSPLKYFNDIYESEYRTTHFFHSIEDEKKLLEPIDNSLIKINRLASEYLESVRVTCFSYLANNNLMWAHYANNHSGVCYCFDFTNQKSPFDSTPITWGRVIYSSLVPDIKIFQDQTTEGMLPTLLSDVILTKSQEWFYEQELRFFISQENNFLKFNPKFLKAIIIGRRVTDKEITELNSLIKKINKGNKLKIKVLYAHRFTNSYDLGIHSNKSFRDSSESNSSIRIPVLEGIKSKPLTSIE